MRFLIALICSLAPNAAFCQATVIVKRADGGIVEGELQTLTSEQLVIVKDGRAREWSCNELSEVRFNNDSKPVETFARVYLHDSSQLSCLSYGVNDGTANCQLENAAVKVPISSIQYVRYAPFRPEFDKQWKDVLGAKRVSDSLVVRRNDFIDFFDGVIGGISADHVQFQLDGESIDVPYAKIEGLVYFSRDAKAFPKPVCTVTTVQGTQLAADSIALENEFSITTLGGQTFQLPTNVLSFIKFTNRSSVFLSDIEPERLTWRPEVESVIADDISQFFQPRFDKNFRNNPLAIQIDGGRREFRKGISALSHSELNYRLAGEYRKFQAIVGIDADIVPNGEARLEIWGDSRKLVDETIKGTDSARPINVDLTSVGRMRIVVTSGMFLGDGDYINLCDARLSK